MKRPPQEEFKKDFEELKVSHGEKMRILANKYGVNIASVYNWENFYYHSEPLPKPMRAWEEWVDDISTKRGNINPYEQRFYSDEDCLFVCMSDTHFGSKGTIDTIKILDEHLNTILHHNNVYILFIGDIIDYGPSAPRGLAFDQITDYKDQLDIAKAFMDKIGERVVAITSGCHSHFTFNMSGIFPEEALAKQTLTGIFFQDSGFLDLVIGKQEYRVFLTHKIRGGSRKNPALGLVNLALESDDFDIGISAHRHIPSITTIPFHEKFLHLINCGSYQGINGYARKGGYGPILSSTPAFYVSSRERTIISFIDFNEAIKYLGW